MKISKVFKTMMCCLIVAVCVFNFGACGKNSGANNEISAQELGTIYKQVAETMVGKTSTSSISIKANEDNQIYNDANDEMFYEMTDLYNVSAMAGEIYFSGKVYSDSRVQTIDSPLKFGVTCEQNSESCYYEITLYSVVDKENNSIKQYLYAALYVDKNTANERFVEAYLIVCDIKYDFEQQKVSEFSLYMFSKDVADADIKSSVQYQKYDGSKLYQFNNSYTGDASDFVNTIKTERDFFNTQLPVVVNLDVDFSTEYQESMDYIQSLLDE